MEVKIGVQHTSRELALESDQSPEEIQALVEAAVSGKTLLRLVDDRGNVVLVPSATLAYVEIGAARKAGVGFGML